MNQIIATNLSEWKKLYSSLSFVSSTDKNQLVKFIVCHLSSYDIAMFAAYDESLQQQQNIY
jgi:hypothetical protein